MIGSQDTFAINSNSDPDSVTFVRHFRGDLDLDIERIAWQMLGRAGHEPEVAGNIQQPQRHPEIEILNSLDVEQNIPAA